MANTGRADLRIVINSSARSRSRLNSRKLPAPMFDLRDNVLGDGAPIARRDASERRTSNTLQHHIEQW